MASLKLEEEPLRNEKNDKDVVVDLDIKDKQQERNQSRSRLESARRSRRNFVSSSGSATPQKNNLVTTQSKLESARKLRFLNKNALAAQKEMEKKVEKLEKEFTKFRVSTGRAFRRSTIRSNQEPPA